MVPGVMEKRVVLGIGLFWGAIASTGVFLLRSATQSSLENQREKREAASAKAQGVASEPVDSGPPPGEIEMVLRELVVDNESGGVAVTPVSWAATCVDELGTMVVGCDSPSSTPVYGPGLAAQSDAAAPAEVGWFSVELQRVRPDGSFDHVGISAWKTQRTQAVLPTDGKAGTYAFPRCSLLEANEKARKAGFDTKAPHHVGWTAGTNGAAAKWTFDRKDHSATFDDDCANAP